MRTNTTWVLTVLKIVVWILFVGICIEAGGFIANSFFALAAPSIVTRLWQQADLTDLFHYDRGYFFVMTLILGIVTTMKAWLFYLIIKTLYNKKLTLSQPFNEAVRRFILTSACIALFTGLFSLWGVEYSEWLIKRNVKMPDAQALSLGGADVWIFMSVILFVIAHIFKKGIALQTENDLTV
ncbi:DUF2975 domain-containing protein [Niabella beijingensis]|uniref:DUF2975 domain-containing protein n=1 Tax=Niabella beijingensis TaxID=2872700 RepID=UPI001CBEB14D|nr:DUF2975 domain-containing protein [Niabella beijingensis]MBZ4188552.1 DUF2975 domain-containing protein [Niabella beijingensis]